MSELVKVKTSNRSRMNSTVLTVVGKITFDSELEAEMTVAQAETLMALDSSFTCEALEPTEVIDKATDLSELGVLTAEKEALAVEKAGLQKQLEVLFAEKAAVQTELTKLKASVKASEEIEVIKANLKSKTLVELKAMAKDVLKMTDKEIGALKTEDDLIAGMIVKMK